MFNSDVEGIAGTEGQCHAGDMKYFFALCVAVFFCQGCSTPPVQPPAHMPKVDLNRYAGLWYEIARYPMWFQRNCAGGVTAEYKLLENGSIAVINRCWSKEGKIIEAKGTAIAEPNSGNARLKVRFFGPFSAPYWIIALDEANYQWAVVGHPQKKFLWILSRTPQMEASTYQSILKQVEAAGYDPAKLQMTDQRNYPLRAFTPYR